VGAVRGDALALRDGLDVLADLDHGAHVVVPRRERVLDVIVPPRSLRDVSRQDRQFRPRAHEGPIRADQYPSRVGVGDIAILDFDRLDVGEDDGGILAHRCVLRVGSSLVHSTVGSLGDGRCMVRQGTAAGKAVFPSSVGKRRYRSVGSMAPAGRRLAE